MDRPGRQGRPLHPWWDAAVGYEVYLRSFADGDGDGVGDLPGLEARLDHLAWLGVDLVWITPCFPSPLADAGYDVADYVDVDARYGGLAALDRVVDRAHRLGMRVLLDLVPNHTSSEHPWFRSALEGPHSPHRGWYVFRDGRGGGPPSNWVSYFGGPAWTRDPRSGHWWMHLFLPEQPDLDWSNPEVAEEFDGILRFWLDRGVDGFRIDVAQGLAVDPRLRDNPRIAPITPGMGPREVFAAYEHRHDIAQPESLEIFRRWRKVVEPYDALLVGEVYLSEPDLIARYVADDDGLHLTFSFTLYDVAWDGPALRAHLAELLHRFPRGTAWVVGSHDEHRAATRLGGGDVGRRRALALTTLLVGLPGLPFVYQGDELGLVDGEVSLRDAADPIATRAGSAAENRDVARTPMPWAPGPGLGFTDAPRAWLPFGGREAADTVEVQRDDPASWLCAHRRVLRARRALVAARHGELEWLAGPDALVAYRWGDGLVAANTARDAVDLALPSGSWRILAGPGRPGTDATASGTLRLEADAAVVLVAESGGAAS